MVSLITIFHCWKAISVNIVLSSFEKIALGCAGVVCGGFPSAAGVEAVGVVVADVAAVAVGDGAVAAAGVAPVAAGVDVPVVAGQPDFER